MNSFNTIAVIGLGYIGLPTAAAFAARRKKVIGVDVNQTAVDTINRGEIHIVEPELDIVVRATVREGYLRATTKPEPADAFLVAVPTPFKGDHEPDLRYIEAAAASIAPVLKKGDLVVLESTSPVGATEQLAGWLAERRSDLSFPQTAGEQSDIRVAHCPERVLPGHVMRELVQNDRVIGGMTPACSKLATKLYKTFVQGECIETDSRTAEMCKLTENAFRDVNIAFANELSMICGQSGVDVWELIKLANRHPRVNILNPGPGVGGHCIAVDPWFIVSQNRETARLIATARSVNDHKPQWVLSRVTDEIAALQQAGKNTVTVACMGLAFKADIDDLRESPAVQITLQLADNKSIEVLAVEPNIKVLPQALSDKGVQLVDMNVAFEQADILLILTDHAEFKKARLPGSAKIIDTRGITG